MLNNFVISKAMLRKVIFLFFNIILLGVLFSCTICNAKGFQQVYGSEIKGQDLTDMARLLQNPTIDSYQANCIFLESTNENDLSGEAYLPMPLLISGVSIYSRILNPVKRNKSKIQGLIERNITPAQYISRNILFHSLQIHF